MDGITSGVWVADKNNVIYYANRAMEMIAGATQQRLIGSKVFPNSAEHATREFRPHYDEAQETLRPVYYSGVSIRTSAGKQTYQSGWLIPKIKKGSYDGMICTGETYKEVVKLTFFKGASLKDPARIFNSSLDGNARRAIDIHEGEDVDASAFKALVRQAVDLNRAGTSKRSKTTAT